jgi:hypothetical protein
MAKQNYMEPGHIFGRSKLVKAFDAKRIDDILGKAATPAAEPPIVEPEAPKAKRGRKAGPKQADTIETPPADDAGINNEDGTDENGADE